MTVQPVPGPDDLLPGRSLFRTVIQDATILDMMANNLGLVALVFLAIYVTAAICAVREIMNSRTSQGTIAWLLSLFFIPYVTVPLYFVFGWKAFSDYTHIQHRLGRLQRSRRADDMQLADQHETEDWKVLSRIASLPFLAGNKCELLIDGPETFNSILAGISAAQKSVLVQFFTIADDELGNRLADALVERAQVGVEVYLLYDDVGSRTLTHRYVNRLKAAGVKVTGFNENHRYLRLLGPMRLNYRNHRKIVVTDFEHTWVGGHNVSDQYVGKSRKFGHWRDTHVKVSGPAAMACALSFSEDWLWANGSELKLPSGHGLERPGDEPVLVMPTGPADELEECSIAFAEAAARARQRLWIATPYFVPSIDVQTALYAAAMRGVDVRILLPEKADHWTVWLASHSHADLMVNRGVKVFRYMDGFLHQKITLVDDELCSIGTVNFDNRSFRINFEITLWFTHPRMVENVRAMLEKDFQSAPQTGPDDLENRSYAFRVLAQGASLFSPIL